MADQHDLAAAPEMNFGLAMDLGHQRTGGVERQQVTPGRLFWNRARHAVRREDHRRICIFGNFGELFDEDGALGLEALDHIAVVHDFVADIDRGPVDRQRPLH